MPVVTREKLISSTSVFILLKNTKVLEGVGYELLVHKKQTAHIRGGKKENSQYRIYWN